MNDSVLEMPSITETVYRYAFYLDTQDWKQMQTLFEPEIEMDFQDLTGNAPGRVPSSGFVDFAASALDGIKTQHIIANPKVTVFDGRAKCVADHQSMHYRDIDGVKTFFILHGTYEFGLNTVKGDWKIASLRQTVSFTGGDQRVMEKKPA
jgi:hypothetical protein